MNLKLWLLLPLIIFGGYRVLEVAKDTILPRSFIFDHKDLQALSQAAIAEHPEGTPNEIFESLHEKLKEKYGDYINDYNYDDWMFNNAGGAMVCLRNHA